MADKIDLNETRSYFERHHQEGKLIQELPLMKAALFGMRKQNVKRKTAKEVYELALQVAGVKDEDIQLEASIPIQQATVFAIIGGGRLGKFATRNPEGFYVDDSRHPLDKFNSNKADAYREVIKLEKMAKDRKLKPSSLPSMPTFHHMGVF